MANNNDINNIDEEELVELIEEDDSGVSFSINEINSAIEGTSVSTGYNKNWRLGGKPDYSSRRKQDNKPSNNSNKKAETVVSQNKDNTTKQIDTKTSLTPQTSKEEYTKPKPNVLFSPEELIEILGEDILSIGNTPIDNFNQNVQSEEVSQKTSNSSKNTSQENKDNKNNDQHNSKNKINNDENIEWNNQKEREKKEREKYLRDKENQKKQTQTNQTNWDNMIDDFDEEVNVELLSSNDKNSNFVEPNDFSFDKELLNIEENVDMMVYNEEIFKHENALDRYINLNYRTTYSEVNELTPFDLFSLMDGSTKYEFLGDKDFRKLVTKRVKNICNNFNCLKSSQTNFDCLRNITIVFEGLSIFSLKFCEDFDYIIHDILKKHNIKFVGWIFHIEEEPIHCHIIYLNFEKETLNHLIDHLYEEE